MDRAGRKTIILMCMIIFGYGSICFSNDSVRIKISCSIPAIPGVNAPPQESSSQFSVVAIDPKNRLDEEPRLDDPTSSQKSDQIQEEKQEISKGGVIVLVKSVYSK
ncbi:MAG: hypothetical protein N2606_07455 [Candidatus Omnitrophica bacterium]|nr:hypothetical protein [Candidatus Omnitrophota bacterium]